MAMLKLAALLLSSAVAQRQVTELHAWEIQSSKNLTAKWYPISDTVTVLAGLVENKVFTDPYYNLNLKSIDSKPYVDVAWHYRTQFSTPSSISSPSSSALPLTHILVLKGINYKANVFLNKQQIATTKDVVGTFRYFHLDITKYLTSNDAGNDNADNNLEMQFYSAHNSIFASDVTSKDLSISFVDWVVGPPDGNLGLWREVEIHSFPGSVMVSAPSVKTTVATSLLSASLDLSAVLKNFAQKTVVGSVRVTIGGVGAVNQTVTLQAGQEKMVVFQASNFPTLVVQNPRLWYPWQMGKPERYDLTVEFIPDGEAAATDSITSKFGIREVTSELDSRKHRLYKVNHQPILIRGGGYSPELLLRSEIDADWQAKVIKMTRDLNLNTIRFEGKYPNDRIFEMADEVGLLMIVGVCCCDAWQHWNFWGAEQHMIAQESIRSQVRRLAIHPSLLAFWYSSDMKPPVDVEKEYLTVFEAERWPNPVLSSASADVSTITGASGVKMSGPYSWVPPHYWLIDTSRVGGAFGFLTEGGPGEAPLTMEMLQATTPQDKLWPMGEEWDFHCGAQIARFKNLENFTNPMYARYGKAVNLQDYLRKSQAAVIEGHKAFFEGYSRNKYTSTGVVQWMLNNAMPQHIWHLFDFYFGTTPSYFATKKACEDVHVMYSYDDYSVWVVNSLYTASTDLVVTMEMFALNGSRVWTDNVQVSALKGDETRRVFSAIPVTSRAPAKTFFVHLTATNPADKSVVSRNTYWLSTKQDVLDWSRTTYYNTPCTSYADLTLLATSLPAVLLKTSITTTEVGDDYKSEILLSNPSSAIAFLVQARLVRAGSSVGPLAPVDITPAFWSDNFVTIFPGQSITLTVSYAQADAGHNLPELVVQLFNPLH